VPTVLRFALDTPSRGKAHQHIGPSPCGSRPSALAAASPAPALLGDSHSPQTPDLDHGPRPSNRARGRSAFQTQCVPARTRTKGSESCWAPSLMKAQAWLVQHPSTARPGANGSRHRPSLPPPRPGTASPHRRLTVSAPPRENPLERHARGWPDDVGPKFLSVDHTDHSQRPRCPRS
jgi:hypothetical protein